MSKFTLYIVSISLFTFSCQLIKPKKEARPAEEKPGLKNITKFDSNKMLDLKDAETIKYNSFYQTKEKEIKLFGTKDKKISKRYKINETKAGSQFNRSNEKFSQAGERRYDTNNSELSEKRSWFGKRRTKTKLFSDSKKKYYTQQNQQYKKSYQTAPNINFSGQNPSFAPIDSVSENELQKILGKFTR